ncbi:CoA transferase [Mycobacterium sp. UM_CSW]|uniref:CaiB/BaiF CoA transferase family protein n=1 Tax=Mycobacterium sp. UM_CSW TaxID=1370119 RepID=UPI000832367A|nr:CoA transferase [Mycobacterium sp. UM_CSW]
MKKPMTGVRVIEVAEYTFVPSAGAVLADWGADVVKIENPVTGDAQRGLVSVLSRSASRQGVPFAPMMEAPNRGKRSIGLSLALSESRPAFEELIRRSDVFLTSYLPRTRAKLRIDVTDVRRVNPDIIYVAGSGFGHHGPDRDRGGYDATAFWARGGSAQSVTQIDDDSPAPMPAGAYGDNIGGLTIAGAVAAALFGRQNTGETSSIDVSLLSVGAWAMQANINLAMLYGCPLPVIGGRAPAPGNPLTGTYRCKDGRFIQLSMLQPTRYWPEFCSLFGLASAATDPRFASMEALAQHNDEAIRLVAEAIGSRPFEECNRLLDQSSGPWAPLQDAWEVANDEALIANGRIADIIDSQGHPQRLVANPAQFDGAPTRLNRAPLFAEHTDEVLRDLGVDETELLQLKYAGAIT